MELAYLGRVQQSIFSILAGGTRVPLEYVHVYYCNIHTMEYRTRVHVLPPTHGCRSDACIILFYFFIFYFFLPVLLIPGTRVPVAAIVLQ